MLEIKNLSFTVPDSSGAQQRKTVIDDLSLTINDGEFIVITGPGYEIK